MEHSNETAVAQSSPEAPVSQKRSRGKYSSRACVDCRARKLKCTGEEPCPRCVRRNQHCIYSDDRAVSEILRRTRHELLLGGVNGSGSLGARVERLERSMQALTERLDGEHASKSDHDAHISERAGFQGETAFQTPIDTLNASLVQIRDQLGFNGEHDGGTTTSVSTRPTNGQFETVVSPTTDASSSSKIRIGSRTLPFPAPNAYRSYLDFFFQDINACHPCINEADFRSRSDKLISSNRLDPRESLFLALHYIMFACADVLIDFARPEDMRPCPGWNWYQAADELIGRTKFSGQGDLSLIQFLILEAFYLTHQDKPNAAYNIAGLACRLCFQFGLHQESCWEEGAETYQGHMKQRILWTAYFVDRRIALSCGRPYGISDRDIDVSLPKWINDQELFPDSPLPQPNQQESFMPYLSCMIAFAKFGGEIWDQMFSAKAQRDTTCAEMIAILDAKIKHWADNVLPTIPLLPQTSPLLKRHMRQHILVHTRVNHLRLLLRRRLMVSLTYNAHDGRLCGELAMDIVRQITQHSDEAGQPSSFRFHMAVSLGGALLILGTLLCRPLSELGLQDLYTDYAEAFRQGLSLLEELATGLNAARRMLADLREITNVVKAIIDQPITGFQQGLIDMPENIDNLFPYGAIDFAQQSGCGYPYETFFDDNQRQGIGYDHFNTGVNGWNATDIVLQAPSQGYGVPWI